MHAVSHARRVLCSTGLRLSSDARNPHTFLPGWKGHLEEQHLHHMWAVTMKLLTSYGPHPLLPSAAKRRAGDVARPPAASASELALARAYAHASDALSAVHARGVQQGALTLGGGSGSRWGGGPLREMLRVSCPLRCGETLDGHAVQVRLRAFVCGTLIWGAYAGAVQVRASFNPSRAPCMGNQ
eukprot:365751-Chlamydomonas_euryale.AAC.5